VFFVNGHDGIHAALEVAAGRGFYKSLIGHDVTNFSVTSILVIRARLVNQPTGVHAPLLAHIFCE
jgi:hypothetical protein